MEWNGVTGTFLHFRFSYPTTKHPKSAVYPLTYSELKRRDAMGTLPVLVNVTLKTRLGQSRRPELVVVSF